MILKVYVQPGASRDEMAGKHGDRMKIRLKAPAVEGKANTALIAFLAKHYNVAKRQVTITKGETSRNKTVFIEA